MQILAAVMLAGSMALFASHARAADEKMTIAVFTKNSTNPAYEAFRIAADQVATLGGGPDRALRSRASRIMSTSRRRWSSRS